MSTAQELIEARGTVRVRLTYPILAHGQEVTELALRRPTAGDMRKFGDLQPFAMITALIAPCASIPPSSVDQLDAADLGKVSEVIGGFLGSGPQTGPKP